MSELLLVSRLLIAGPLGVLLAAVTWAYWPALSGYLAFDDYAHIAPLFGRLSDFSPWALWEAIWSSNSGPTGRPLAMLTFSIEAALPNWGVAGMKVTNLVLHLGTGLLLYRLASILFEPPSRSTKRAFSWSALIVAGLWLLHPLQLTSVAYLVQRMNQMSAFFVVLAVLIYLHGRVSRPIHRLSFPRVAAIGICWLFAMLSKENAALLPVFVLLAEGALAVELAGAPKENRRNLRWLSVAVGAWLLLLAVWLWPQIRAAIGSHEFGLVQRLATQGEILAWYLKMLMMPDLGQLTLYHDQWPVAQSFFSSWSSVLSSLLLVCLVVMGWILRRRAPLVTFGIAWYLGGHLMESTVLPLELVYEHRNYLPSFGFFVALVAAGRALQGLRPRLGPAIVMVAIIFGLAFGLVTHQRAWRWADEPWDRLANLEAVKSPRAAIEAAQTYQGLAQKAPAGTVREDYLAGGEREFSRAAAIDPESPDPYFGWLMFYARTGQPVPERLTDALDRRLTEPKGFNKVSSNGLAALTRCVVKGPCRELESWTTRWNRRLAADDSALSSAGRARMLHNLGRIECQVKADHEAALASLQEAAHLAPKDFGIGFDLALCLAKSGRRDLALRELSRLEAMDRFLMRFDSLSRLRWTLMAAS